MLRVYMSSCGDRCWDELTARAVPILPSHLLDRMQQFRRREDAHRFLLGKWLLVRGLEEMGYERSGLARVRYTKYDKPYLPGDIHFNISHAGDWVLCAMSNDSRVGVDVEEVREVRIAEFSEIFTRAELNYIYSAADDLQAFYTCWTRKEAVIKADGRGLNLPLSKIDVIPDEISVGGSKWFLRELPVAMNYIAHLATDRDIEPHMLRI